MQRLPQFARTAQMAAAGTNGTGMRDATEPQAANGQPADPAPLGQRRANPAAETLRRIKALRRGAWGATVLPFSNAPGRSMPYS
jgi:hypothetical protein